MGWLLEMNKYNVSKIIIIIVTKTNNTFVLNPKLDDAKTLGIIKKIINGKIKMKEGNIIGDSEGLPLQFN